MNQKISLDKIDLEDQLKAIILGYSMDLQLEVNEIVKEVAKEGAKKLRARSPKKSGNYSKGWTVHTSTKNERGIKTTTATIHNKKKPTLTHLLEKGHLKRDGSKVQGQPHIEPTAKEVEEELLKKVEEAIRKY